MNKIDNNIFLEFASLLNNDSFEISILANTSAFLNQYLDDINWVGFYILKDDYLLLGPFQGKVACTKIKVGNGVCGSAVQREETLVVSDVHQFPNHIVCDLESKSEIVIPIFVNNQVYGVLDLDSPSMARFKDTDKVFLEKIVKILEQHLSKILSWLCILYHDFIFTI